MFRLRCAVRLVQDHTDEQDFSSECKEEVARDQVRSNQDYRCVSALLPPPQCLQRIWIPGRMQAWRSHTSVLEEQEMAHSAKLSEFEENAQPARGLGILGLLSTRRTALEIGPSLSLSGSVVNQHQDTGAKILQ